jgi:hypothetical protein
MRAARAYRWNREKRSAMSVTTARLRIHGKAMYSGLSLKVVFRVGNAFAMETTSLPA